MKRIVYTRHSDSGVDVCVPVPEIFRIMQCGGYWDRMPRGFVNRQIDLQIEGGIAPDHARRFAHAVAFGGCSEAEVWDIIKDRDCARHGTLHELIDTSDLPDRWFRDAWRRSPNGGPVVVSLPKARLIQWDKIFLATEEENKNRSRDLYGKKEFKLNKLTWQRAIEAARDEDELRRIMPDFG